MTKEINTPFIAGAIDKSKTAIVYVDIYKEFYPFSSFSHRITNIKISWKTEKD